MDFLEKLFGDPADLLKRVITHTSAGLAKPVLVEFFNHRMNANGRVELGKVLVRAGQALQTGDVAVASDQLAGVIGEIKL